MDTWQQVFGAEPERAVSLLTAVARAQSLHLDEADPRAVFEVLLGELLSLTQSEYGFVGEVLTDPATNAPYLKTHAITNIAWDDATRKLYDLHLAQGLEFRNLNTLFGRVLTSAQPVLANDAPNDPRKGGIPQGHPPLRSFLGLPVHHAGKYIGMIGLANRPGGFDMQLVDYLRPLVATCGTLIHAHHSALRRRATEVELSTLNARLSQLIATTEAAVLLESEQRKILVVNQRFCDTFGIPAPPEALLGADCSQSAQQSAPMFADPARFVARIDDILARRQHVLAEVVALADGRVLERDYVPIVVDGIYRGHYWQYRDITARVRAEQALREAKEQAESASRYKSDFLASMSHEIRTPMTAIVGYADMILRSSASPEDRAQWSRSIRQNADYLLSLVNGILDLSKVEAGQMTLDRREFDVPELVAEIDSLFRPRCSERMLAFTVRFDSPVPRRITSDPTKVKQVLVNLLSNAVRFTDAGRVDVVARYLPPETDDTLTPGGSLEFSVRDTGIGIPPDRVGLLFAPFSQVHTQTPTRGGTGLGLAISRRIARLLGGDVAVSSEPGVGSTFVFRLDLAAGDLHADRELIHPSQLAAREPDAFQSPGSAHAPGTPRFSGRRILLVDDNPDNLRIVRFFLEETGATVTTAEDGARCLAAVFGAAAANLPFDAVLLDMQMPVMDGYTAAAQLRRAGVPVPVIALTAYAMSGDRDRCLAAGCDDYLSKPVVPAELYAALRRFITPAAPGNSLPTPPPNTDNHASPSAPARPPLVSSLANDPRFGPLVAAYRKGLPETLDKLRAAIANDDAPAAKIIAHRLRGSGTSYGYPDITTASTTAETAAAQGQNWQPAAQALIDLLERAV